MRVLKNLLPETLLEVATLIGSFEIFSILLFPLPSGMEDRTRLLIYFIKGLILLPPLIFASSAIRVSSQSDVFAEITARHIRLIGVGGILAAAFYYLVLK